MENIFIEEKNFQYFLNLWGKYIVPVAETYSYCLMKNHFHFLVRIRDIKASEVWYGGEYKDCCTV